MKTFRDKSFGDRRGQAAEAKKKALEQLRSRPPVDEAVAAERKAASDEREKNRAEKAAAKKDARQAAAEAEASAKTKAPAPPSQAELKAARDARYAARKKRK